MEMGAANQSGDGAIIDITVTAECVDDTVNVPAGSDDRDDGAGKRMDDKAEPASTTVCTSDSRMEVVPTSATPCTPVDAGDPMVTSDADGMCTAPTKGLQCGPGG